VYELVAEPQDQQAPYEEQDVRISKRPGPRSGRATG
jgi:hypothetical protein